NLPRLNASAEGLRQDRTERLVFPCLNIARAPVVHQHDPKNVVLSLIDGNGLAQGIPRTNKKRCLQFQIEALARAENRSARIRRLRLSVRSFHLRSAND